MLILDIFPGLDAVEDLIRLPLGPYEVVSFPLIIVAHGPPETGFQGRSHDA